MAPIRVGFLGLSKSGWAPKAHLPYLIASPDYEIVALCNSTAESASEAIALYNLPSTVKAYGDPQQLADDKDIDLVVCSVRVDRHLPTIAPSLKAGKDVFVEWPLGKSAAEARELLRLKNEGGVKLAVVGLQARQAPIIAKIKEIIKDGRIGDVLSSSWVGAAGNGGKTVTQNYEYLGRKEVGGNLVSIHFGHCIDYIQEVLGYGFQTSNSVLANRCPEITLQDDTGKTISDHHPKTSDDTIFLNGILSTGIPLSLSLRGGPVFKGTPGLDWRIYGSKGEIRITAIQPMLQIGSPDMKIELVGEGDEVENVAFEEEFEELPLPGRNVARVYRALKEGKVNCSFEDAVERHALIEKMYKDNGYTEGS